MGKRPDQAETEGLEQGLAEGLGRELQPADFHDSLCAHDNRFGMNFLFCALILALVISSLKSEPFAKLFLHKVSPAPEAEVVAVSVSGNGKLLLRLKLNETDSRLGLEANHFW